MTDTGINVPESLATLLIQQQHLIEGWRAVQMFPLGSYTLPVPSNMRSVTNHRGTFHYNPGLITRDRILYLSLQGRENEFLGLGPFNKEDINRRLAAGEVFDVVSEYTPSGTEVRTAIGTNRTIDQQKAYFEQTKQEGNVISCGVAPQRVEKYFKEAVNG